MLNNGRLIFIRDCSDEEDSKNPEIIVIDSHKKLEELLREQKPSYDLIWRSLEDKSIQRGLKNHGWIHIDSAEKISESVMIGGRIFIYDEKYTGYGYYATPKAVDLKFLHEKKDACKTLAKESGTILCEISLETIEKVNPEAFKLIQKEKDKIIKRKAKAKETAAKRKEKARLKKLEEARKVLEEAGELSTVESVTA